MPYPVDRSNLANAWAASSHSVDEKPKLRWHALLRIWTGYPHFIGGERDCPPEDCGGISGFYDMLEIRSDPTHEQHAEINDWLEGYDPEELDILPIGHPDLPGLDIRLRV